MDTLDLDPRMHERVGERIKIWQDEPARLARKVVQVGEWP